MIEFGKDFEIKSAFINTDDDFGANYAQKLFGDDILSKLPLKKTGKRKGQYNACLEWIKVNKGGYTDRGIVKYEKTARLFVSSTNQTIAYRFQSGMVYVLSYGALTDVQLKSDLDQLCKTKNIFKKGNLPHTYIRSGEKNEK